MTSTGNSATDARLNKKARRAALKEARLATAPPAPPAPAKTGKVSRTGLVALPALKRARKPKAPKSCACGCGGQTRGGRFLPGHDARLNGWVLRVDRGVCTLEQVEASDGAGVRAAVERAFGDR